MCGVSASQETLNTQMQHHGVGQRNLDVGSQCGSLVQSYQLNFHNWCLANARRSAEHIAAAKKMHTIVCMPWKLLQGTTKCHFLTLSLETFRCLRAILRAIKKRLAKIKSIIFQKAYFYSLGPVGAPQGGS